MYNNQTHSVKKGTTRFFAKAYRKILTSKNLTWGQKCLMFAILDAPPNREINWAAIARKLHVAPQQIHRWRWKIKEWYQEE